MLFNSVILPYGNPEVAIKGYSLLTSNEIKEPFKIQVQDVMLKAEAEFIVVITGKIMTMPGLPKEPAAEKIDIDENGEIVGIF